MCARSCAEAITVTHFPESSPPSPWVGLSSPPRPQQSPVGGEGRSQLGVRWADPRARALDHVTGDLIPQQPREPPLHCLDNLGRRPVTDTAGHNTVPSATAQAHLAPPSNPPLALTTAVTAIALFRGHRLGVYTLKVHSTYINSLHPHNS